MQQGVYLVEYFPFLAEKNGRQLFSILSINCAVSVGQCHQCQERAKKSSSLGLQNSKYQ